MQIHYKKNIHFTRLLKANGRLREFNFRKINSSDVEPLFTVDVSDDRGNRILFRMSNHDHSWKIDDRQLLPAWIIENENKFSEVIEDELKSVD